MKPAPNSKAPKRYNQPSSPMANGNNETASNKKVYSKICSFVYATPCVTGSIGIFTLA